MLSTEVLIAVNEASVVTNLPSKSPEMSASSSANSFNVSSSAGALSITLEICWSIYVRIELKDESVSVLLAFIVIRNWENEASDSVLCASIVVCISVKEASVVTNLPSKSPEISDNSSAISRKVSNVAGALSINAEISWST